MSDNILFVIQDKLKQLTKSEQKIAHYILAQPEAVMSMSASELAEKSASSPAAIIRFSRSVGAEGFTDLKLKLSSAASGLEEAIYTEIEPQEKPELIKKKLSARMTHVLNQTNQCLDNQVIENSVTRIEDSEVIYIYGVGASALVAQDIYQKFSRLGKMVFYDLDHHLFASTLGTSPSSGTFIGISNSGTTPETIRLAKIAKEHGMHVLAVTSVPDSKLALLADDVLLTAHAEEAPLRTAATVSLTAQLYAVDVFFLTYAAKHYDDTLMRLQDSKASVKQMKENN